ncbi:MAG: Nif3-like dinuclear metal center hexameric protein [Bacteroidales bacterium]|nr:Nif3-like dinuclear metal center hexameric protein [Bacteroidales bacterium]
MTTIADVCQFLNRFAPPETAADWDNVGLLAGDTTSSVERVMTCLTITRSVVEEALTERVALVVSHHPILFRGVKQLTPHTPDGRLLLPLLRAGVAVYSPHTAFDNCPGGINDGLCARLGLTAVEPLRPREVRECKLTVFVPESDREPVSDALFAAGAGVIGEYEQCSFRVPGTGSFFGRDSTHPTLGQKGRREEVAELRLEVIVPEARLPAALAAMRAAHSYEEPAFDVYPLRPRPGTMGEGRIGTLASPRTLGEFAQHTRQQLSASSVQVIGDSAKLVTRVALACGAAGEFLRDAIRAGADLFLTGEMRFHDGLTAQDADVGVVLPGHYATERPGVEDLAHRLAAEFPDVAVWASRRETDPLWSVESAHTPP